LRIANLLRTAPDWTTVDPLSAEVTAWLQRAHQAALEFDSLEVRVLQIHLQFFHNDIARHGSEIVEMLRRIEGKLG